METLQSENSDIVSSYNAGTTYESRDMKVMVVKTETSQKGIWIDCGIHAVSIFKNFYLHQ